MEESRVELILEPLIRTHYDIHRIAEAMPQLVWSALPDGTIDYFNERWIAYTGLRVDDLALSGAKGVVHPEELDETWRRWRAAIQNRTPYEIEYRLRHVTDGSYRWFLSRAVPLFDDNRNIVRWIGTATDINEQKRARDSLALVVEVGTILSASLDIDELCQAFAGVATKRFTDWCFITLKEEANYRVAAMAHKDLERVRYLKQFRDRYPVRRDSPLARVIATNTTFLAERVAPEQLEAAAEDAEHLQLLRMLRMHSVMIVPLSTPEGAAYGAITFVSAESGHLFDQSDVDVAKAVAKRVASTIHTAKLFNEEKRTSQRLHFISRISKSLFESSDLQKTFDDMAEIIVSDMADACLVATIDGEAFRVAAVAHKDPALHVAIQPFRGERTLLPEVERTTVEAILRHEPYIREHPDVEQLKQSVWPYLTHAVEALNPTSSITIPLYSNEATYGALFVYYTDSGRTYSQEDIPALIEAAHRTSLAIANTKTLEREKRIATTLQQASLPSLAPQLDGLHFDAVYSPAGEENAIGGDWYDAIELDDGSVVISVGDVTGRGLEAAVIMSKVRHAMGVVPRHDPDPARILDSADWFLGKRYPDAIVTAFVAIISPDRKTIRYANAGHPYPLLRRRGELRELQSSGVPLGLRRLVPSEPSKEEHLEEGDLLVLYTDGLIEWGTSRNEGSARLRQILKTDAIRITNKPAKMIAASCIPDTSLDDVAILAVSLQRPERWSFFAENAQAAQHIREKIIAHLRERIDNVLFTNTAELIFGELIGNVVRHAPGPTEIYLDWTPSGVSMHVLDSGPAFEPRRDLPRHALSEYGRGLYIIRQLTSHFHVEHIKGYGNHVSAHVSVDIDNS